MSDRNNRIVTIEDSKCTDELIANYHVSLKKLLQQDISNPEFYGDLVYQLKKTIGNPNLSDLFNRIVYRLKKSRVKFRHCAADCMPSFNPIMVESYDALFGCTAVIHASDSMTGSM